MQWHTEKNGSLSPKQILPGSAIRVWWRCNSAPCHEWESTIYNRTSKQPNGECSFCKGTRLSDLNSLAVVHPEIAAEWHPTMNSLLNPIDVTRASGRRVWWKCSKNPSHEWETIIRARTIQKSGCPLCDIESRSDRLQQAQLDSALSNQNSMKTFQSHLRSVNSLIKQISPSSIHSTQAFYRMVYASIITAVEAYLSDTFYCLVITDPARTERLLTTAPEFLEKKYSVAEVLDWHKNLAIRLSDYLHGIAWHNLGKVRPMYETVLNIRFPENSGALHRAVAIRHDIVHRNGRSKDHRSHRFSAKDIYDLIAVAEKFVNELEVQLKPQK